MANVDGAFIIDKPAGVTSHDVVARVRKIIGQRRVGHTGTLDPFATGVLVVLVGRATRLAQFLSGAEKEYEAVIRLGSATDTGDLTGAPRQLPFSAQTQRTQRLRREEIEAALGSLRGEIEQTPPMYSAKKISGDRLYELARRGEEVERKAIRVSVHEFETINHDAELLKPQRDGTCDMAARVVCSAGTYIRALAEDFGKQLGVGAHLRELRRTRAGAFKIEDACTLDRLNELMANHSIEEILIPPNAALAHLTAVELNADDVKRTLRGIDMRTNDAEASRWTNAQPVRMLDSTGELIAVGVYDEARKFIHPKVVIAKE